MEEIWKKRLEVNRKINVKFYLIVFVGTNQEMIKSGKTEKIRLKFSK